MPTNKERLDALEKERAMDYQRICALEEVADAAARQIGDILTGVGKLIDGVERLTALIPRMQVVIDDQAAKLNELTKAFTLHNNAMVDDNAALLRRIEALEQKPSGAFSQAESRPIFYQAMRGGIPTRPSVDWAEINEPVYGDSALFPTGGASTAAEAAEAVAAADDPPRRGDRVRLEGARSIGGHKLPARWYDVLGVSISNEFQVRELDDGDIVGLHIYWVDNNASGLKEIRRGAAYTVAPEVDEKDLDV